MTTKKKLYDLKQQVWRWRLVAAVNAVLYLTRDPGASSLEEVIDHIAGYYGVDKEELATSHGYVTVGRPSHCFKYKSEYDFEKENPDWADDILDSYEEEE